MSLKRKLQEIKEEDEKQYTKKQLQVQSIIKRPINMNLVFIMKGDALVCFDNFESDRFSKLNLFKKISKCTHQKEGRYLEIEMLNSIEGISDFRHVVKMLKDQPSQYMHDFGQILEKHQNFVDKQLQIASIMKKDQNYQQFKGVLMKNSETFEEKIKQMVQDMESKGELKFYTYKICKLNSDNFMYELQKYYMSELLLALMGFTMEQAQTFILRKGVFDYSNITEMCQHIKLFLDIGNEGLRSVTFDTELKTFDGIVITVKMTYQIIFSKDLLNLTSNLLERTEFAMISNFDVSQSVLDQVRSMRQNSVFNFESYENEQDWDYSEEVSKFLEAYYEQPHSRKKKQKDTFSNNQSSSPDFQSSSTNSTFFDVL